MTRYDLIVIGSGPAGYVPAIRASQLGARVAVVEEEDLGGTCLNRGCIPTKTLAATADLLHAARTAGRMGLRGSLELDFPAVARRRDMVVTRLRKGIEARMTGLGIEILRGRASLKAADAVAVGGEVFQAANIGSAILWIPVLIAPGSIGAVAWDRFRGGDATTAGLLAAVLVAVLAVAVWAWRRLLPRLMRRDDEP